MLAMLLKLLRPRRAMDPLQVSMTGVRMGERFLQIGCDDRALLGGLAAKVGLSGSASAVVFDDRAADLARKLAAAAGALVEIQQTTPTRIEVPDEAFDMVVVDDTAGTFSRLGPADRAAWFARARRAVRAGGRIEVIESATVPSATEAGLLAAGFKPVRVLAETDGRRFVEGLRPS